MTQQKLKCEHCGRIYSTRAIVTIKGVTGCHDCLARLSKGKEPLKYGRLRK
jgi:hypothetical protein